MASASASLPPVLVYFHPTMRSLAESIVRRCHEEEQRTEDDMSASTSSYSSAQISRRIELRDDIQWEKFEDGFPNLFIKNVRDMANREVLYLANFFPSDLIFEQLAILYALPRYLAKKLTVILPYFPTGTMERIDYEGQVATAMTTCRLLSMIPLSQGGPCQIVIYDIHALQERFYFSEMVIPRLESGIPLLLRRLKSMPEDFHSKITIAFPDDGAHKRFAGFFKDFPTIICAKVRVGDKRIVTVKEGDPKGRHIVIVDDLVKTGGTLIECAKAMSGSLSCSAYATHAVFPQESWRRFQDGLFSHFWVTDSCPTVVGMLKDQKPFEVISLSDSIAETLLSIDLTR